MSTIKDRILCLIQESEDRAFLRQEFNGVGSRSAVNQALAALVREGRMVRIGYGVYIPAEAAEPTVDLDMAVVNALQKLGAEPEYGGRAWRKWMSGRSTQIPVRPVISVRKPVKRKLGLDNLIYRYEYPKEGEQ